MVVMIVGDGYHGHNDIEDQKAIEIIMNWMIIIH